MPEKKRPATPLEVRDAVSSSYLRYFETAFWLRSEQLRRERRRLLETPGVVFADPLLEPLMPFPSGIPLAVACRGGWAHPLT